MSWQDVFAGTCGGIAVTLVGHPFDTVKVRLQTQPMDKPIYNGVVDCVQKTVKWEGVGGLYKGVTSPLVGQMFFRSTLFGAFAASKSFIKGDRDHLDAIDYYTAGFITGAVSAFVEGPIDFYKSQLQVQVIKEKTIPGYKPAYTGLVDVARKTWKINGAKSMFQGLGPTLLRNAPANSVYLGSYEVFKNMLADRAGIPVSKLPLFKNFMAGGVAGTLYWLLIFPVDVIKSSMMSDAVLKSERKYSSMMDCTKQLMKEGGIGRFYRGFLPCLLRSIPANGTMLVTVDLVRNQLMSKEDLGNPSLQRHPTEMFRS